MSKYFKKRGIRLPDPIAIGPVAVFKYYTFDGIRLSPEGGPSVLKTPRTLQPVGRLYQEQTIRSHAIHISAPHACLTGRDTTSAILEGCRFLAVDRRACDKS
jgi:hypothetical protein